MVMKAHRWRTFRFAILSLLCISVAGSAVAASMSVQVRLAPLRATPSYLAAVQSELAYGDRVNVLETQRGWSRVEHPDGRRQGWLHASALTSKRIVLQAGDDAAVTASSQEVALAGKGFNQQVENELRERRPELDFSWVDRMEAMSAPAASLQSFLVASPEGGAQ